jgi:hypothetical protein
MVIYLNNLKAAKIRKRRQPGEYRTRNKEYRITKGGKELMKKCSIFNAQ